jgi:hypothetical protein
MLKGFIQRLLDTRTTPAQAGHNAMPVNIAEAIDIFLVVGSEGSYTAPADGYLSAMVEPGGNMNFWGQILPISSFPIQNVQGKLFVPMAKGMEVRYFINGTVSLSKFLKTIGGGYNVLIWRALPCLKSLSNFSRKVFSRAKGRGSVTSHTAGATLLRSRSLLARLLHTWHHRMASSLLQVPHVQPLTSLFKVLTCESTWHALKNKSLQVTSHCQKDSKLTSLFLEITSKATQRNSSLQSVQANLRAGGALC